jgi:RNA polymerase sigma-70 factor (ECF subfamily)
MGRTGRLRAVTSGAAEGPATADELLGRVARGSSDAFAQLYDLLSGAVYGLVRGILRDPAQSEEVTQEVLVDVWRRAATYDADRGSATAWIMTIAHRRAVDRVRREEAAASREERAARETAGKATDPVAEEVETRLEHEQVRRCLGSLTELQLESIQLAYYRGYTYPQVAELLSVPLGTVKTRLRDGLIRLRDCLGVAR